MKLRGTTCQAPRKKDGRQLGTAICLRCFAASKDVASVWRSAARQVTKLRKSRGCGDGLRGCVRIVVSAVSIRYVVYSNCCRSQRSRPLTKKGGTTMERIVEQAVLRT